MVLEEQGPELQRLAPSSPGEQACWLRATPRHRSGTGQRPAALQASSRCSVAQHAVGHEALPMTVARMSKAGTARVSAG
eukprot:360121-Chlamydomonas_euryale.AAC.4